MVTAIGIFLAAFVSSVMTLGMKQNLDALFEKRTLSLISINEIKELFGVNILDTIMALDRGEITREEALEVIDISKGMIETRWQHYKEIKEKNDKWILMEMIELFLLTFVINEIQDLTLQSEDELIHQVNKKFLEISEILRALEGSEMKGDGVKLKPLIDNVVINLGQLTKYHLHKAIHEKELGDAIYSATFWVIFAVVLVVFLFSLVIERYILENIKELHTSLQNVVDEKTKDLKELNESLERRVALEIKESRKKDEMLYRQSRLASMGEMIANIAHQWRQPLNTLIMIIQSFKVKMDAGKLTREFVESQVEEGMKTANSMSSTIEDFRNFFRPNNKDELFSLKNTLSDSISLLRGLFFQHNIQIELLCKKDVLISGYPNQLSQVIINILNNAKDAIVANGVSDGKISIFVNSCTTLTKKFAIILIIDNGGGIDESKIERIFEPYFTTKHQTVGTGIGLYMSKRIIEEQFLGKITAKNKMYDFKSGTQYKCALFSIKIPQE